MVVKKAIAFLFLEELELLRVLKKAEFLSSPRWSLCFCQLESVQKVSFFFPWTSFLLSGFAILLAIFF